MGEVQIEIIKRWILSGMVFVSHLEPATLFTKRRFCEPVEGVGHYEPLRHYAEVHLGWSRLPWGAVCRLRQTAVKISWTKTGSG